MNDSHYRRGYFTELKKNVSIQGWWKKILINQQIEARKKRVLDLRLCRVCLLTIKTIERWKNSSKELIEIFIILLEDCFTIGSSWSTLEKVWCVKRNWTYFEMNLFFVVIGWDPGPGISISIQAYHTHMVIYVICNNMAKVNWIQACNENSLLQQNRKASHRIIFMKSNLKESNNLFV